MIALLLACRTTLVAPVPAPAADPTQAYADLLARVVTNEGFVDYDLLAVNRAPLDAYVAWLGRARNQPHTPDGGLAMYLNAYNALVLFSVLEHGRPASVKDVPGRWVSTPGAGFFVDTAFAVGRDHLSLWEIEHERIRRRSEDLRAHAAMNCASRSCPPMVRSVFKEKVLDAQLDRQMKRWINDPERGVRVDGDEAVFSPIFDWFSADFHLWTGGDDPCTTAAAYAQPELATNLKTLAARGCPHRFADYDWRLNDAKAAP